MALSAGRRLGAYEILGLIGSGGMGEVYRARDRKLNRDVALKVLPDPFALDADRLTRFTREAQVLASLNHPNIGSIHGLEEVDGVRALVLELIEGPTLADRIAHGPMPLDEALAIARQIADALEAAHERGIIHRDLKPTNIKLRPDGAVKVLDFGLAKALAPGAASATESDLSQSPTITSPAMTHMGVILGTAAYMSPEQAKGKVVDKRADIWAFGCVLYEMLTGRPVFGGEEVTDVLARVIEREPDFSQFPVKTPTVLARLVRRCLQKDPKRRLHDIGDARLEIEEILASPHIVEDLRTGRASPGLWRRLFPWALASVLTIVAVGFWLSRLREPQPIGPQSAHVQIALPIGIHLAVDTEHPVLALSPDGSHLVFVGDERGTRRLYVRDLADPTARVIPGTEGAASPFFSTDGAWIAFFDGGTLKKVSSSGGVPVAVHASTSTEVNRGATWIMNDSVIIAASPNSGLSRGSVAGERRHSIGEWDWITGNTEPYAWPHALSDGRHVLFTDNAAGRPDDARVAVLLLQTSEIKTLVNGGTNPRYSPTGHVLFARGGALYAVPFDAERAEATGPERKLFDGLMTMPNGAAQFTVGEGGTVAYVTGNSAPTEEELVWVDRRGAAETLLDDGRTYQDPRLSPDDTRLAFSSPDGPNYDVWIRDLVRGSNTRLTTHPGEDFQPVWSPDGNLAFASEIGEDRENPGPGLAWMSGSSERLEPLLKTPGFGNWEFPSSWSPDGQWLAFAGTRAGTSRDILLLPTTGAPEPRVFLRTPSDEAAAMFSPDGRWISYVSDETGRFEVYVRPFPGPGEPTTVSTDGGVEPLWARNGQELFYRNGTRLMAVRLGRASGLVVSVPQILFEGRFEMKGYGGGTANYDVSRDGRFVMVRRKNPVTPTIIHVVLNWPEALEAAPRATR